MSIPALTFDDISVIPAYSSILPSEVDVSVQLTPRIRLNLPILSAAMDTVTESQMAIAMAQLGGLGVIHKNMSIADQVREVETVKRHDGGIVKSPYTVYPYQTLSQVKELVEETGLHSFPVVIDYSRYNKTKKILVGMITARDIKFQRSDDVTVEKIMTPIERLNVASEDMSLEKMEDMMYAAKVEKLPVVRYDKEVPLLVGLVTIKDMEITAKMPNALRDKQGKLIVAAAIGVADDSRERADRLIEAGVNALVVDSAHGHSKGVMDMVFWLSTNRPEVDIIAGNVVTRSGVEALYQQGAHAIKVGIGPGCFVPGTNVVTREGYRPIEEVEEGTEVLTHKGRWRKVIGKAKFYDKKEIATVNGISSTVDHLYYVVHRRHKEYLTNDNIHSFAEWIEAKDLTKEYLLIKPREVKDE